MPGNPVASYAPPTVVTDAASVTIDVSTGGYFTWTLGGNRTVAAFTNPPGGVCVEIELVQDATGSRTVTWPSTVTWAAATAPTLTTTAAAIDLVRFTWNGTANRWRGETVGKAYG